MRNESEKAAPFAVNKFRAVEEGDLFGVAPDSYNDTLVDSEANWKARYNGPETADYSPTRVYRVFDADGTLLYVGASSQIWTRLYRHWFDGREWGNSASWLYVETYPNLDVARAVESGAILHEDPIFNRRRLPEPFGRRSMRGYVEPGDILTSYNPFWATVGVDLRDITPSPHPRAFPAT